MKYYIITYGCQMNKSDSERIAKLLQEKGHKPVLNENKADLIIINACSVRQSAIDRVFSKVNKFYKKKRVIIAGCLLAADRKKLQSKVYDFWHPDKYFACSPIYQNKLSAFLPIMTGCNNFCTYCAVPYTRGREKSKRANYIIKEAKNLIKKGYKEIVLLGQNVNSYKDGKINFAKLLEKIAEIDGDFKLSFITSHPKDMSDELIKTISKHSKISRWLNLPVQSGDNTILKKMNRKYTAQDYINLVKKIRKKVPGVKISTDIIVGFPGETLQQFKNTVKLAKKVKFENAYIARFSPRAGTPAAKLKDNISINEKKRRWLILEKLINKKHARS